MKALFIESSEFTAWARSYDLSASDKQATRRLADPSKLQAIRQARTEETP